MGVGGVVGGGDFVVFVYWGGGGCEGGEKMVFDDDGVGLFDCDDGVLLGGVGGNLVCVGVCCGGEYCVFVE